MDRMISMTAFVQVVERGTFAAAAKQLEVSPATVTHHVQSLEDRLGIQLLNRTTRKISLTEAGAVFYERAVQILGEVEDAERLASALQTTPRGTLRLNTSVTLARLASPLIAEYTAIYPDVAFEVIMSDGMVDMVDAGFDLALRAGPLKDSSLIVRRLGLGELVLCAAPDYLAQHGTPAAPADLTNHNCLTAVHSFIDHRWGFRSASGRQVVEVTGNLRSNSVEGLRAAALAGQGISLLPALVVADDINAGHLIRLLPDFATDEAVVHAIYPASRHVAVKVRTFLDFLVKRLREDPRWTLRSIPGGAEPEARAVRRA
jgi:DNA-binding transcriptional LysR family regulator